MARQTGDWWSGYKGESTFRPDLYDPDASAFGTGTAGMGLLDQLYGQMQGRMPSVAEQQMQQSLGQQLGSAQSLAAGSENPALAQRLASQQMGSAQSQAALGTGLLRAQEQAGTQAQLMGLLGQNRQAAMSREQMMAQQQNLYNQLMMQQDMQNALGMSQQGWGPQLLQAGATVAGALI